MLTIVALGDSLTEGFGVAPRDAYPYRLQGLLQAEGVACRIVNAGISGDTCRGVLARLGEVERWRPDMVILEIGINDVLMGVMTERIRANIDAIVERLQDGGIPVVLAGMDLPPMGEPEVEAAFAALYPAVAEAYDLALIPGSEIPINSVHGILVGLRPIRPSRGPATRSP